MGILAGDFALVLVLFGIALATRPERPTATGATPPPTA